MRLLLNRKYLLDMTVGKLSINGKKFIYVLELAHQLFNHSSHCIPEGIYKIIPCFNEDSGWYLSLEGKWNKEPIAFKPIKDNKIPQVPCLVPVTFFKEKRIPMYSNLANIKLRDRVFQALDEGEEVELEIISSNIKSVTKRCLQKKECI